MVNGADDDAQWTDEDRSKSQRKRDAAALQELGVRLIDLPASELDRLPLPEKLRDAIDLAKRITSHGALFRQRQFIGKLMRHIDTDPIVAALEAKAEVHAEAARHFHRLEQWRERLVTEGDAAFAAFVARYPEVDEAKLRLLVRDAVAERANGAEKAAQRLLFKAIRAVETTPEAGDADG